MSISMKFHEKWKLNSLQNLQEMLLSQNHCQKSMRHSLEIAEILFYTFRQKFRESNVFTKDVFAVRKNVLFFTLCES